MFLRLKRTYNSSLQLIREGGGARREPERIEPHGLIGRPECNSMRWSAGVRHDDGGADSEYQD